MNVDHDIRVKVAAVQSEPVWFDGDKTVDKAVNIIEEAAKNGAQLVAFPELYVSGYPWWIHINTTLKASAFYKRGMKSAMSLDSERMKRIMTAARKNKIYVVMGYSEFDGSSLYMSQAFISDTGEILANRRKLKPTHAERTFYGEGDGSDILVVDTPLGKIGGLNCWEHFQPLSIYAMTALHEQIHVASWPSHNVFQPSFPDSIESNYWMTSMYAALTQTFVLSATTLIGPSAHEAFQCTEEQKLNIPVGGGWATIFDPNGVDLTKDQKIPEDQEGLVYADIDLMDILQAKVYRDPVGQYSRPDIFTLHVNRKKNEQVVFDDSLKDRKKEIAKINEVFLTECEDEEE